MAKRGDQAREAVMSTIKEAFGSHFLNVIDKKLYVEARDGNHGEMIQFAISITMPKVPISVTTDTAETEVQGAQQQTDLSPEDKKKVADLMAKLGLV